MVTIRNRMMLMPQKSSIHVDLKILNLFSRVSIFPYKAT